MPSGTAVYMASRMFARAANIDPLDIGQASSFYINSKSKPGAGYWMKHTPEGFAVHVGEGCEAEQFHGPLGCWHSKTMKIEGEEMTTAMTVHEDMVPVRIDFSEEQIKTIADVICVNSKGERAPASFVQLFLAAARRAGLDPFLKQIWAMEIRGKWTMFVGVDGYRAASFRTGVDDGMDGPEFSDDGNEWFDFPFKAKPNFCRVGIWRKGVNRPFVATLRMDSRFNENSDAWRKDAAGMLAKCCESLARRRAFPADLATFGDAVDVDDAETGAPLTRAEVTEGAYRELPEGFGEPDGSKVAAQVTHEKEIIKNLNLDADREQAAQEHRPDPTKQSPARKAAQRAKAPPAPPVAPDEAPPLQEQYDNAFREALEEKAAAQEAEVVARPEPPEGQPQSVANPPETKAQEMSKFWASAKKFEKDTSKIIAASKEHFGAVPAELEGTRRAQLIALLETGELPEPAEAHEPVPVYTEDGVMVCEVCKEKLDEETGKHAAEGVNR